MSEIVVSASQLEKVSGCVRAAGFHYIDRIVVPEAPDARMLGSRVHKILELYASLGIEPDLLEQLTVKGKVYFPGQIAAAALPLLPKGPAQGYATEHSIDSTRLPSGIPLTGSIDMLSLAPNREVRDYKTTSDFRYVKTSADLMTDIQAQIYAYSEFLRRPEITTVDLHWQYLLTKGLPRSQSTRTTCSREHTAKQIERIDAIAGPWVQLRKRGVPGAELPPTGLANGTCEKYSGCPYRGIQCQVTIEESLRFQPGANMDLATLLTKKLQSQSLIAQVPPPAGFGPPAPPPGANPFAVAALEPVVAVRPSYWMPGDPMNEDQEHFASKGKSLAFIAQMADNPPPTDVCAAYDGPKVEAGIINPPESAGMVAAPNPVVAAALAPPVTVVAAPVTVAAAEGDDFATLKARAQALGILPEGKILKTAGLKKLLAENGTALKTIPLAGTVVIPDKRDVIASECAEPSQAFVPTNAELTAPVLALPWEATERLADLVADRVIARLSEAFAKLAK